MMERKPFGSRNQAPARREVRPFSSMARSFWVALFVLALVLVTVAPASARETFPPVIPLPNGFQPEGIAIGRGANFYAGSIPTGAIFAGSLRTGEGEILVPPQEGRAAVGMKIDRRTNYLFVAGGPTGQAYVYDASNGASLAEYQLAPAGDFINDVIVTRRAAYFTNSTEAVIYRLPLGPGGSLTNEEPQPIELTGDYVNQPGAFNANGIAATENDRWLIVVNTSLGALYRVDPDSGEATLIDLGGGSVPNGDGILLHGRTLYVVQNQLNQIAVVKLSEHFTSGKIVRTITDSDFRVPTTIAEFGAYLYAVNARFGTPPTPDTEYEIVQVRR